MDEYFCIISGIIMLAFAIPFFIMVYKAKKESDWGHLAAAMVFLLNAIGPGYLFFVSLTRLMSVC